MQSYGGKQLAAAFRTVRNNTTVIAEEIPADKYDFKATPDTRSVREILAHIVFAPKLYEDMHRVRHVSTLKGYDFVAIGKALATEEQTLTTKEAVVTALKSEGARFASWLESLTPEFLGEEYTDPSGQNPKSRFESLLSPKEHEMHHRSQLMMIQRLTGQVPHLTRQLEERRRARAAAVAASAAAAG